MNLAIKKPLALLTADDDARLFDRGRAADPAIERAVAAIVADVRSRGDAALLELARRFDRVELEALEVPPERCEAALESLDPAVRAALEQAAEAIAAFHRAQLPPPLEVELRPGVRLGRRAEPLRRVGVYAPGGRASYPSSVLMGVVPARVAGVGEVVVCSPPGPDGLPPAAVLAACALAGADRVFALGGAGAVAAMAYGTASVPRMEKIVGPGNAYVTEAKRQLTGAVAIDCPAGPSEILIVADETADPELIAIELLAQAEHDPDAAAVLVTTSGEVVEAVAAALERLIPEQPRREIIEAALAERGAILLAASLGEALRFAERYAPEHLLLLVEDPRRALERVRAAGTIFLGPGSSVAFGDYITGANHVLPTAGLARACSGLSVLDFVRWATYQEVSDGAARELSAPTATLADAEGLPAHALAARVRGEKRACSAPAAPGSGSGTGSKAPGAEAGKNPSAIPFRPAYRDIELYDPARRPIAVDLSDNTNLFGVAPAAARALASLGPEAFTRYPPVFADRLKRVLAELHGVAPENVTTGCGSDDVIDSAFRAFCEPGDVVAYPEPTFGMIPLFGRMNAARPVGVALGPGFALDTDALLAARGRITYLCQPNNPTGTRFDRAAIERVAAATSGILLIDEAYADFAGEELIEWAVASERVAVLRTLSKAYGLAGLRIGYAIGPAPLVREIEKSRGPYKITAAAHAAALAVLAEDREWVRGVVARSVENRERLAAELRALGLRVWPSAANYLLVARGDDGLGLGLGLGGDEADPPAVRLRAALMERGVLVRAFPGLPQAGDCIRVSVGPWEMMEKFLGAMKEILGLVAAAEAAPEPPPSPSPSPSPIPEVSP